jgi:hypothetical protein
MSRYARRPAFRLPVSPDDVVRHALAAYYRAVGDAIAPLGEPAVVGWSDPSSFLEQLVDFFGLRLHHEAALAGHPVEADSARYLRWSRSMPHGQRHIRDVDPARWAELCIADPSLCGPSGGGRSPSDMGHGCPALSPAVGPAPTDANGCDITVNVDTLCAVQTRQGLPVGETSPHTQPQQGETHAE